MTAALALAGAVLSPARIEIDYQEFPGLQIKVNGIPMVQGSAFQYYEQGWTRGIYSSNWRPKQIEKLPNAGLRVRFEGDDGNVVGFLTFERTLSGVKSVQEFRWRGSKAVRLENCLGLLWGPALEKGTLTIDGEPGLPMDRPFPGHLPPWDKQFGKAGSVFRVDTAYAVMNVKINSNKAIFFDARGHGQDWAENRELFWLGFMDQKLAPRETLRYEVEWSFDIKNPSAPPAADPQSLEGAPLRTAVRPSNRTLPLIPAPKKRTLTQGSPSTSFVELGRLNRYELAERHQPLKEEFERMLWRRWSRDSIPQGPVSTVIEGRVQPIGLPAEGYRLTVAPGRISLAGQDEDGLRNAFRSLAWLAQARNGKLTVPFQEIEDWPSLPFRGLHMFVGPTALGFQTRLMDSYFAPLKINNVVIQCERTNWKTLPGIETPITMKKEDLRELFARYRTRGIEPIPLIQSLGHTYWVFENGRNLDIAINPQEAFTLDPRKDRTRQVLSDLWDEAITLLQPKTIHFGLDEIDMRGIPDDPTFSTRLWTLHVPWLMDLAEKKGVKPMLWGDIMLGPGEGPDALHAKTKAEAALRRKAVRPGAYVADWHYLPNPDPDVYTSLGVLQASGFKPIASTWYQPANIYGFAHAAIKAKAPGLLQTTWAGYESSEAALIREFDQFSAYALAADYAWSGRPEQPSKLPYDPREVLTRLYFSPPEPVISTGGGSLLPEGSRSSEPVQIGPISFRLFPSLSLYTPISADGLGAPSQRTFRTAVRAKELAVAVDSAAWVKDNEVLAKVTIALEDGSQVESEILYGRHARAPRDPRPSLLAPRSKGLSAVRIPLDEKGGHKRVREVKIQAVSPAGGLRIHGLTWVSE